MTGKRFTLEVQPTLPPRLKRLEELANDLLYSWDRQVRSLFFRLDRKLWESCGHNPKVFLRRVAQHTLDEAEEDRVFVQDFNRVLSAYDTYVHEKIQPGAAQHLDPEHDLVAYFCAEFGLHESFPVYSGGLGILAGDHCKAASDLGIPFVGVGMVYCHGYFTQTIDGYGNQVAHYTQTSFGDLPIVPAVGPDGREVRVHVELSQRSVEFKVWKAKAGHITLYLLDSGLEVNSEEDQRITYQLYGGDINTRIQQEITLGIGGVRALRAIGLNPTVWHINEGHAAFLILERCRELAKGGLDFDTALEVVAANTVFTTHTPVPAGHDIFDHGLMTTYFANFIKQLGITKDRFLALGTSPINENGFNQTALALHGSRFHNGVSRIHGGVASHMESYIWPQIPPEENPMSYVTNGVHVPTFLASEWVNMFDMRFGGGWRNELLNPEFWYQIDDIPDSNYWSLRLSLKATMIDEVRRRATLQHRRNGCSEAQIERLIRYLIPHETDILTIGFARRFATYKRATLLFSDPERLARLVNDPKRPMILMFAGKAHPSDLPGQHLIKVIHDFSRRPEFEGKIVLLEGYDLALARKLVMGVDVWLNTPEYPLEASGTSGEKAGINGVLNLSVLDGWWGEGFDGENGWAITPHSPQVDPAYRNHEEANELLHILEHQVAPLYYERDGHGYSEGWVARSKASMRSLMPRFNAQRMVMDYVRDFYSPANAQCCALSANNYAPARDLAQWKKKIARCWPEVKIRRTDEAREEIKTGETLAIRIAARLNGLDPEDVIVECLVGKESETGEFIVHDSHKLLPLEPGEHGETIFAIDLSPTLSGLQYYKLRIFPYHRLLSHRFEMGRMVWL